LLWGFSTNNIRIRKRDKQINANNNDVAGTPVRKLGRSMDALRGHTFATAVRA